MSPKQWSQPLGIPLFPGTDEADQLRCIARLLGEPPAEMIQKSSTFSKLIVIRAEAHEQSLDTFGLGCFGPQTRVIS
ncbi:putative serine/threonine-protein kinase dyrk2 [Taenia solium]|eukprot:TsM_001214600 transcript=TsM_001214600 gene=TsM_001214600